MKRKTLSAIFAICGKFLLLIDLVYNAYPSAVGEKHPTAARQDRIEYL